MLTGIKIKNFKGIESLELTGLKQVNQIVGANEAGKTSIAEAIQFLRSGSARDRSKLKEGAIEGSVEATFLTSGHTLIAKRLLFKDDKKKASLVLSVDGELRTDASKQLLDKFFGVASFDPLKILEETERVKVFESLVEKSFEFPAMIKKDFPRSLEFLKQTDTETGAITQLNGIKKELSQYRLYVGREKHDAESIMKETDEEFKSLNMKILHSGLDVSALPETGVLMAEKAQYDADVKNAEEIKQEIGIAKDKIGGYEKELQNHQKEFQEMRFAIEKNGLAQIAVKKTIKDLEEKQATISSPPEELYKKIEVARIRDDALAKKKKLNEREIKAKEKKLEYENINSFLQTGFSSLYSPYLQGISEKVPGLTFIDGEWRYNERLIKDLSRSQLFALAIKIISSKGLKENVVCLDNAECLDPDTAKELGLREGVNLFLFSVEKKYNLPGSKVVELTKKVEENMKKFSDIYKTGLKKHGLEDLGF